MKLLSENRRFPRLIVNCEISFKPVQARAASSAIAKNISGNGVLFVTAEQPAVGDVVEITLCPGVLSIPELSAIVEVVRVENGRVWEFDERDPADSCFGVGARIMSMK